MAPLLNPQEGCPPELPELSRLGQVAQLGHGQTAVGSPYGLHQISPQKVTLRHPSSDQTTCLNLLQLGKEQGRQRLQQRNAGSTCPERPL